MSKYSVIAIPLAHDNPVELENKIEEVSRYFYGRSFLLDWKEPEMIARRPVSLVYWLVEEHYIQHIIDRLASGLFAARRATPKETHRLLGSSGAAQLLTPIGTTEDGGIIVGPEGWNQLQEELS